MVAVPPGLPVGKVVGRFLFVSQDTADADTEADYTAVSGTVKFTCSSRRVLQASNQKLVIVPLVFDAQFDSEGYLIPLNGNPGVRGIDLPASSSSVYNPSGFTWRVDFNLRDVRTGNAVRVDSFSISVQEGVENDLADLLPVGESGGVIVTRGEQGEPGPGLIWSEAAGRTAHALDTINNRHQLIFGDTGWRMFSIPDDWPVNGSIYLRRFGHTVFCYIGIILEATPAYTRSLETGAGWDGWTGFSDALAVNQLIAVRQVTGSQPQIATAQQSGTSMTLYGLNAIPQAVAGFGISAYLSWSTIDPWPTSLPGVEVIAPPIG